MKRLMLAFFLSPLAVCHASPSPADSLHSCLFLDPELEPPVPSAAGKRLADLDAGEPRTVRLFYFLPNDRPFRPEVVQRLKDEMSSIQAFYGEQMEAHGYGYTTFRIETDDQGDPVVHRVDGQHADSHYIGDAWASVEEIRGVFDLSQSIVAVVLDNSNNRIGSALGAATWTSKQSGVALVGGEFEWQVLAHELAHTFRMGHDFRDDRYILSYGHSRNALSACSAGVLAVHPYFNPDVSVEWGEAPTVELLSGQGYPEGSESVPIRLRVGDADGLQLVRLRVLARERSGWELKTCRGLMGAEEAVVEIDYDGVIPSGNPFSGLSDVQVHPVSIGVVDRDGNRGYISFDLWETSRQHLATFQPAGEVHGLVFAPGGDTLVSGSESGAELWDVTTGTGTTTSLSGVVTAVALSSDGATLATGSGTKVELLEMASGQVIATLPGHSQPIRSLAFSPDGGVLASGAQDGIRLWDVAAQTTTATLPVGATSVAFSPDGSTLVSGSGDGVRLWDVAAEAEVAAYRHDRGGWGPGVNSVAFSPDGTLVASGGDDFTVRLWDVARGETAAVLGGPRSAVRSVAFSADGGLVAAGEDRAVYLWDPVTEARLAELRGEGRGGNAVAFSPDGTTLAAGTEDGHIGLWDVSEWVRKRPRRLAMVSGDGQQGSPGEELANSLVVEVLDQNGDPMPGVEVTFRVVTRDGTLGGRFTEQKVTTDTRGRAEAWLTLGSSPGRNSVEATVAGLTVTFRPEGIGETTPFMDGDLQTWHLPDGAMARLGKGRFGIWLDGDRAVAFSPDGRYLAVQSAAGTWLYDADTANELALLPTAGEEISSLAFSPDGRFLATASSHLRSDCCWEWGRIRVWDIAAGQTLTDLEGHRGSEFLDGSGRSFPTLEGYEGAIRSLSLSPDGTLLASAAWEGIRLWDVVTRTGNSFLGGYEGPVWSVVFSADGKTLAAARGDRTVHLWDVTTGRSVGALEGHGGQVRSVSFSPDGRHLASGAEDRTIRLWDIAERQSLATLDGHEGAVRSVSFSPDGRSLASGSEDETVRLWDVEARSPTRVLEGHGSWVRSVAFSPDGRSLASAGTWDGRVNLWDLATGSARVIDGYTWVVYAVSFSPDGEMLASGVAPGEIELWDVRTAKRTATLSGHAETVRGVAFSPDGRVLASGSEDGTIKLWDVASGDGTATLEGHTGWVRSVSFSPDGNSLASASSDFTIRLWDVATESRIATFDGHRERVTSVVFSPDGATLASGSFDRTVKLWDLETVTNTATLEGHADRVRSVSFSPDGKSLASGSDDGTVRLWDVATATNTATLEGHANVVSSVAFAADGTLVSGSWEGTIKLWDRASGQTTTLDHGPRGRGEGVYGVSSSGDILASGGGDGLVLLWDMQRLRLVLTKLSGDGQVAAFGSPLAEPLVVEVRNRNGQVYPGAVVTFSLAGGSGTLSALTDTTDADGRAAATLTLGEEPGTYTVVAKVAGLEPVTFSAKAKASPDFDGDGEVGFSDFFLFAEAFGSSDPRFDLDGSGFVYFADFLLFAEHFGQPARARLVAMAREMIGLPEGPQLRQNAPNPFNSGTVISWFQLQAGPARLEVYALTGQRVAVLHEGPRAAGLHRLRWDARDGQGRPLASGVYVYRLVTAESVLTRKLTLLK